MMDGVGRVCWAYCQTLEKKGHEAYYIAPEDPDHSRFEGLNTVLYHGLQIPGRNYRLGVPDWSFEFRKTIKQIPFDLLHIHSPFLSARVALEIRKENPQIPMIATFHSKYYDDAMKITHSKKISRSIVDLVLSVYNKCDEVWALNHETADVLRAYGYKKEITIVPNGTDLYDIDENAAREARLRLGIPAGRTILLFIGQMSTKKNIHCVLRAASILKRQGMDFTLLLGGVGPDYGSLQRLAESLELGEQARFLGFIREQETLRNLYAMADLFVFPSLYDNAPMVVREAAVNETPALLVRGSCSAEGIEDGVNGFLCDSSEPEDIARRIREVLPMAKEVGVQARKTIPIPWDGILSDVLDRYESCIRRKRT